MKIQFKENSKFLIVKISGKLNADTYQLFVKKLKEKIENISKDLILDFSNLEFISSAGLRAILIIAKELDSYDRKLVIINLSEDIKHILEITGFCELFPIFDNLTTAKEFLLNNFF